MPEVYFIYCTNPETPGDCGYWDVDESTCYESLYDSGSFASRTEANEAIRDIPRKYDVKILKLVEVTDAP